MLVFLRAFTNNDLIGQTPLKPAIMNLFFIRIKTDGKYHNIKAIDLTELTGISKVTWLLGFYC